MMIMIIGQTKLKVIVVLIHLILIVTPRTMTMMVKLTVLIQMTIMTDGLIKKRYFVIQIRMTLT